MTVNRIDDDSIEHEDAAFLASFGENEAQERLEALRNSLAAHAERAGVLDVAFRTVDTPVGELLIAATDAGLLRVVYPNQGHDAALAAISEQVSPRILRAPRRLDDAARQLDEYFAGRRRVFELPLDMQLAHGFRRQVLDQLREIAYGATASYTAVATAAGHPKAVRAVGTACARNPLPVVVPCHRVVRSDGATGGYAGGTEAKRALLRLEAA
jgi:methylated-DNA-[protein]-cysteine S-methyltransferase